MENKTSNLILSICLATYNQPDKVKRFFESIIPQLNSEINQQIEIVVRDDSANSETENLIKNYFKKTPVSIRYFKGKKEGLDTAIIFLTQEAKGDYVWWFGDDVLAEGAISHILKLVKKFPQIFFIWVNSCDINHKNDTAFKLEENKFFDNRNQLLEKDVGLLGFISATIFKREKALSGIKKSKKYIGSAFVNLYLILHVLSQDGKFYFLNTPYVISEPKLSGEQRWYDPFQVFGINLYKIVYEFKNKFNEQSIRKALADNFRKAWRAVVVERAMGFITGFGSKTPKIKQMFKYYWSYPEFYIALPLFLMPRFILRIFYKIYKFIKQQFHKRTIQIKSKYAAKNNIKEIIICNICQKDLLWDDDVVLCTGCGSKFSIQDGIIQFLKEKNKFYEGVYARQIKYIPQKNFFKNWFFFNFVQSGILGEIKKMLRLGGRVLDVGCGGGIRWLGIYAETIGIDISQKSLIKTKRFYKEALRSDIQKMPLSSSSMDCIYSSYVFEHLFLEEKNNFLSEVFRVLKPGGACVLQLDTLSNNWITRFALRDKEAYQKGFIDTDGHVGLEPLSVEIKKIERAGMKIIKVIKFGTTFLQYQATYNWLNISYGEKYAWIRHLSRFVNWILNKRMGIALEFFVTAIDKLINPFSKIDSATRAIIIAKKPK